MGLIKVLYSILFYSILRKNNFESLLPAFFWRDPPGLCMCDFTLPVPLWLVSRAPDLLPSLCWVELQLCQQVCCHFLSHTESHWVAPSHPESPRVAPSHTESHWAVQTEGISQCFPDLRLLCLRFTPRRRRSFLTTSCAKQEAAVKGSPSFPSELPDQPHTICHLFSEGGGAPKGVVGAGA